MWHRSVGECSVGGGWVGGFDVGLRCFVREVFWGVVGCLGKVEVLDRVGAAVFLDVASLAVATTFVVAVWVVLSSAS